MIYFTTKLDRFSNKSISFEINEKTNELEIDSEEYTTNGLSGDRHIFNLSKDEAKKIVEYLSVWVSADGAYEHIQYSIPIYEDGIKTKWTVDGIVGDEKYYQLLEFGNGKDLPDMINTTIKQ